MWDGTVKGEGESEMQGNAAECGDDARTNRDGHPPKCSPVGWDLFVQ